MKIKQETFRLIARLLEYLGGVRLLNRFANRFRYAADQEGKLIFPFLRRRHTGNVQILVYHRINNDHDPFFPGIPIAVFRKQMEYLTANFTIYSLEAAVEELTGDDVPDNAIVITFDDGYRDNYINALPILRDLSIPATIFLATGAIGAAKVLWHDRVFAAFRETRAEELSFGVPTRQYSLDTLEQKLFAQGEVLKFLRFRTESERLYWIDVLIRQLGVVDRKEVSGLMLSWDEVKSMQESGITFGSHSVSHPILTKVQPEQARQELGLSKMIIERELGISVRGFAYPNGSRNDFDLSTKELLREIGYAYAVTTVFGANEKGQDLFELRRATPWDQDIYAFALRLNHYKLCA